MYQTKFDSAMVYFKQSLDVSDLDKADIDSVGLAKTYSNLGTLYSYKKNYVKAKESIYKSLKLNLAIGDSVYWAKVMGNYARTFYEAGQLDSAEFIVRKAFSENRRLGNKRSLGSNLYIFLFSEIEAVLIQQ